jgi:integrase
LLEPEQINALAAAIRPDLEAAIWLGAGCGLRIGETLGLRVWTLTGSDGKYTSPSSAAGSR